MKNKDISDAIICYNYYNWIFALSWKWRLLLLIVVGGLLYRGVSSLQKEEKHINISPKSEPNYYQDKTGKFKKIIESIEEPKVISTAYKKLPDRITQKHLDIILNEYERFGILPSIKIAQLIVESREGQSKLALDNNNFYGSKYFGNKHKNKVARQWKFINKGDFEKVYEGYSIYHDDCKINGTCGKKCDRFYAFNGFWASNRYHTLNLLRYKKVNWLIKTGNKNPESWINAIQKHGYATSKKYKKTILKIIKNYNLTQYDK